MFWMRLGDAAEYESFDSIGDVAERLRENGVKSITAWREGGCYAPGFEGNNYISLYVGDADANLERSLTPAEQCECEGE